jgi:hypothetical protein
MMAMLTRLFGDLHDTVPEMPERFRYEEDVVACLRRLRDAGSLVAS